MESSQCWAKSLGNCRGKLSREHYVSEAFFSESIVSIKGLSWCKLEPRTIGIGAATAKILCQGHNSDLSPLDDEIARYMKNVKEHLRLSSLRVSLPANHFHVIKLKSSARLLERWLLKVLLNLSVGSQYLIGPDGVHPGIPPASLVNICFGNLPFEGRAGMYVGSYEGMSIEMGETLSYSPLIHENQRIVGGFFTVAGIRYFFWLLDGEIAVSLQEIEGIDPEWSAANLHWRFKSIQTTIRNKLSHSLEFHW
jgi:hypothetical protein